jgi:hypothetical protein
MTLSRNLLQGLLNRTLNAGLEDYDKGYVYNSPFKDDRFNLFKTTDNGGVTSLYTGTLEELYAYVTGLNEGRASHA